MVISEDQWKRQEALEDRGRQDGIERFRRWNQTARAKKRGSTAKGERQVMKFDMAVLVEAVENGITSWLDTRASTRGAKPVALEWIEKVGPDVAAYHTLRVIFDRLGSKPQPLNRTALALSEMIEDELRYRLFKEKAPHLFEYRMSRFTTTSYEHMARSLNAAVRSLEIDTSEITMTHEQRFQVGACLLGFAMRDAGVVEKVTVARKHRGRVVKDVHLRVTQETLDWIAQADERMEWLRPVHVPMVVPPRPWGRGQTGGYFFKLWDPKRKRVTRGVSEEHQAVIDQTEMPTVYAALNRIQETAWTLNRPVLEIVRVLIERGGGRAGLPDIRQRPLPERPRGIEADREARKAWRRAAAQVLDENHHRKLESLRLAKVLATVDAVEEESAFWFPYNLDFRGRVYPIAEYLSPQGDDLSRGLLTFATGKPLGATGARWLALHGANCLGVAQGQKVSKMTLDERVDWIERHTPQILRVAADPLGEPWWMDADEPFQFLAFCFEWSAMHAHGDRETFVSHLPVSMDGTCNGLQHFSALLRDPIGGAAVNLVPQDRPQDIYQHVADKVLDKLEALAAQDVPASLWLSSGLVDRKLTKRPTMTYGYGSRQFGFREQLEEYLEGLPNWLEIRRHFTREVIDTETGEVTRVDCTVGMACTLMAKLIFEALQETVVAAAAAMDWMQASVRVVAKGNRPFEWTVPATGFPVRQEYFEQTFKRVKTMLAGEIRFDPLNRVDTENVDGYKQANAVAPNFIHSLDAAALMLTVTQASAEGVDSFMMIHDSYGTHAGDAEVLARVTRRAFVRLYTEHDVVGLLAAEFRRQAPEGAELPEPPAPGDLDLAQVLASDYFFA